VRTLAHLASLRFHEEIIYNHGGNLAKLVRRFHCFFRLTRCIEHRFKRARTRAHAAREPMALTPLPGLRRVEGSLGNGAEKFPTCGRSVARGSRSARCIEHRDRTGAHSRAVAVRPEGLTERELRKKRPCHPPRRPGRCGSVKPALETPFELDGDASAF
jgi:hypothetical protein